MTAFVDRLLRRKPVVVPGCSHAAVIAVESGDAVVAGLCLAHDCGEQLPAEWFTCAHELTDVTEWDDTTNLGPGEHPFGTMYPGRKQCRSCGSSWWQPVEKVWMGWI